jgi:hypothetical protein
MLAQVAMGPLPLEPLFALLQADVLVNLRGAQNNADGKDITTLMNKVASEWNMSISRSN